MTMTNEHNDNPRDEPFTTPSDVAGIAARLDRLADADRRGATGVMRDRIARASGVALSAGEDQALARTASALDRLALDDRSGADQSMAGRVASAAQVAPAGERAPVLARIGGRQWRMAAGIAVAGLAVGGATWLMGPTSAPSVPVVAAAPDTAEFDALLDSFASDDDAAGWASPFDDGDGLAAFESSVGSAVDSLRDPWGGLDWMDEGGSL